MMRRLHTLAAASLLLLPIYSRPAYCWAQEGHSIIAEIAQRELTPAAASKVQQILGGHVSLASIASWADDMRASRPETSRWHNVGIPRTADAYDAKRDCADTQWGDCLVAEIQRATRDLECAMDAGKRKQSLELLVHFVGDIHQPFHAIGFKSGEYDPDVTVSFAGLTKTSSVEKTDLHAAWDSSIIRRTAWDWGSYVERLETGWLAHHSADQMSDDVTQWALETHALARKVLDLTPTDRNLDDAYYEAVLPLLDQQLGLAGRRLALLLNESLGKLSPCAVRLPQPSTPD